MPRIQHGWPAITLVIAATWAAAACVGGGTVVGSSVGGATPAAAVASGGSSARPPTNEVAGPPAAALAADGGDPVAGQLGTYTWAGGGSDSPWLRGARLAVGVSEPLTMTFRPTIDVDAWTARYVPSTASDPAGAHALGTGVGTPGFEAPDAGSWTVEVHVVFADGAGNASYFWDLAVS